MLVLTGRLAQVGQGRAAHYVPAERAPAGLRLPRLGLAEDRVWDDCRSKVAAVGTLKDEALSVFQYAFTELLNNAIDHSESEEVAVRFEPGDGALAFEVVDEGVGAFDRLRKACGMASNLDALLMLSKGKLTSDPARHTGEGLFFVSKVADLFRLESGGLSWTVDNLRDDVGLGASSIGSGTRVRFEASLPPRRSLRSVFDAYTDDGELSRTRTVVRLFAFGVRFISRSEARRLLRGLDRFREVILDFAGVDEIGQGFADEVFRVWPSAHPTALRPERMSEVVATVVRRAAAISRGPRALGARTPRH
jgi:anti-sigma regulatory factor (Ser/Thr protein kinase)